MHVPQYKAHWGCTVQYSVGRKQLSICVGGRSRTATAACLCLLDLHSLLPHVMGPEEQKSFCSTKFFFLCELYKV